MIRFRFAAPWALALLGACASTSGDATSAAGVDSIFAEVKPDGPGCAVGVYQNGETVLTRAYGLADLDTPRPVTSRTTFDLGSASKAFTALAVLQLEEQRRLSLDDEVRRYVPELRDYGTPIRIRDLVQHTSGIRDYGILAHLAGREPRTTADFLDLLAGQRALNFAPGTRHEYSHSDYLLLAIIVERLVGRPFGAHLEQEVLAPLGITGGRVDDARRQPIPERAYGHFLERGAIRIRFPESELTGGSNLYLSVDDLARWDRALDEAHAGNRPLVARLLTRPTLANGDTIPYAFGLHLRSHRGLPMIIRGGNAGGIRSEIIRFPEQRFGVAVLCNGDQFSPGGLGLSVAELWLGGRMLPEKSTTAPTATSMTEAELARYAGVYADPEIEDIIRFVVRDGRLTELLPDTLQTVTPRGEGRFTFDGTPDGFVITFTPVAGGGMNAQFSWQGEPTSPLMSRLPESRLWRPDERTLAEYSGIWFSDDLEATWELALRDQRLTMLRRGAKAVTLVPIRRDAFSTAVGPWNASVYPRLRFERNGAGSVTGLTVNVEAEGNAARGVRFVRRGR